MPLGKERVFRLISDIQSSAEGLLKSGRFSGFPTLPCNDVNEAHRVCLADSQGFPSQHPLLPSWESSSFHVFLAELCLSQRWPMCQNPHSCCQGWNCKTVPAGSKHIILRLITEPRSRKSEILQQLLQQASSQGTSLFL